MSEKTISFEEFEALKEQNAKLMATNERILSEHKADKNKWRSRFEEFEKKDQEAMKAKNDFESLYHESQKKIESLSSELTTTRYNTFEKNLALEVSKLAKDAHNPNAILRALNIGEENTDLENGTLTDLSTQIDELRQKETYLFNTEKPQQASSIPRYMQDNGQQGKSVADMSSSEIAEMLRNSVK